MSRFVFVLSILSGHLLGAQVDSLRVFTLDEIIIYEDKLKNSEIALNEIQVDSLMLRHAGGSNFSELMRMTGAGQIRSYGSSGLSTPSFRGSGGSHTAILWNGISLQSPLSGQQDLSLIPIGFVEEVKLQKGGTTSLYGSGAIGGSIQLNNQTRLNQELELSTGQKTGSFGNHYQHYQLNWSNRKFGTSTRIFRRYLTNDFPYTNPYVRPQVKEKRSHASVKQKGVLQQNDWRIAPNQLAGIKLWYQDNTIEIPNSIIASSNAAAVQKDEFIRGLLFWNLDRQHFSVGYKQAYIQHQLNFLDSSTRTNSTSIYKTWTNRVEADFDLSSNFVLVSGINYTYEQSEADTFGNNNPDRNSMAIFSSLRHKGPDEHLLIALNIREEVADNEFMPIAPSVGISYFISPRLQLNTNVSRNYRIPTFNDLYWNGEGGKGNANLQSEISWSEELGCEYVFGQSSDQTFSAKVTVYNSIVDNWIIWRPGASSVWTPDNVKQVWLRGLETRISGHIPSKQIYFDWNITYNFTKTTNQKVSDQGNSREVNKQLFYTPLHEGSVYLKATYQTMSWIFIHSYTGKQYTDGDNSEVFALPSYQVVSTYLSRTFDFKNFSGSLRFEVNNLLGEAYENRRGYPMYGRNCSIGLDIQFNKKRNDD